MKNKGLGKGFNALFEDTSFVNNEINTKNVKYVKISTIEPNKNQPRKDFNIENLKELADSITTFGVLQPLLVKELDGETYQIIAGERRWRAARMAGLDEIPVLIKDLSEQETTEITLIENLQREDLNPIEEAIGFKELLQKFDLTQEEIATRVGKSRPFITNAMRVLNLPTEILELVRTKKLSSGHARAILSFPEDKQLEYALIAVKNELTVRQLEKLSSDLNENKSKKIFIRDSYYDEVEISLKEHLGNNVKISSKNDKGKIFIEFINKEQLDNIIELLSR